MQALAKAGKDNIIMDLADLNPNKTVILDSHLIKTYRDCKRKYYYFNRLQQVPKHLGAAAGFGIAMHEGIAGFRKARRDNKSFKESAELGKTELFTSYKKSMPPEMLSEISIDEKRGINNAIRIYNGFLEKYESQCYKYLYVEQPFALHLGTIKNHLNNEDVDVLYVGIIDCVLEDSQGIIYVDDLKTTGFSLNENWLDSFRLDQGLLGYVVAVRELLNVNTNYGLIHGILVNAPAKTPRGKQLSEYFQVKSIYWTEEQIFEWVHNTLATATEICHNTVLDDKSSTALNWPMSWSFSCKAYNGCEYKKVCGSTPLARGKIFEMDFKKAIWTPLEDERLTNIDS